MIMCRVLASLFFLSDLLSSPFIAHYKKNKEFVMPANAVGATLKNSLLFSPYPDSNNSESVPSKLLSPPKNVYECINDPIVG